MALFAWCQAAVRGPQPIATRGDRGGGAPCRGTAVPHRRGHGRLGVSLADKQSRLPDGRRRIAHGGRSHSRGRRMVYCAQNPAAALLEILVHFEIALTTYRS